MSVQDRPYQREFVDGNSEFPGVFGAWDSGKHAVLGMLPTGCGKTICAGLVALKARERGWRTLFLAHREELIRQGADKVGRMGLTTGIEMGPESVADMTLFGIKPDVTVATVQSMQGKRLARHNRNEFGVIITDEAHHARARSYRRVYDYFQGFKHLGITATPDRGDKLNIGAVYEEVAFEYSLRRAIKDGWLCPIVTARMPCGVNLKDIRTTGGDYNQAELEIKIAPHVEALCDIVMGEIGDRPTVIFCPDVGSAEAAADCVTKLGESRGSGVVGRSVSGRMSKVGRRETLEAFSRGDFQVLTCCDLLIEGWDCPRVACVVVMRPTKQRSRYVQMIGRGTRPFGENGEKPDCLIIDFAWETTEGHELVTPIDLFDDSALDDAVAEIATELLASGKEKDPIKAIEEAEHIYRDRPSFQVRITGATTTYKAIRFDPVGLGKLLNVPIKKGWDFNPANPATIRQAEYLERAGVDGVVGLSRSGAGKMIDAISKRRDSNLATLKQMKYAMALGMDPAQAREMTFDQAGPAIDQLKAMNRRVG